MNQPKFKAAEYNDTLCVWNQYFIRTHIATLYEPHCLRKNEAPTVWNKSEGEDH